ncbi:efflux RND transporter periplasmic adaptor subunit [Kineobactrum sediminis]|nr:HlyD family efflux transporter periplasmic adaptor subunit [Kineobactrum sediminis]
MNSLKVCIDRLRRYWTRKNRVFLVVVAVAALGTTSLLATAPRHDPRAVEEKIWPVTMVATESGLLQAQLDLFGRVETPRHAELGAGIDAEVLQVHIAEGERVTAGQLLVSLDAADVKVQLRRQQAVVAEQEAAVASLARDFAAERTVLAHLQELRQLGAVRLQRFQSLHARQLVATEQRDSLQQDMARLNIELAQQQALVDKHPQRRASAEAALERARADLDQQRLQWARSEVRAPFDGRISSLQTSGGERVQRGHALLSLFDSSALQVRVALPAGAADSLQAALARQEPVNAMLTGHGIPAQLLQLASAVERGASGTEALFQLAPGVGAALDLGRVVDIRITLPGSEAMVALPPQSLYENRRIFLVKDDRLQALAVEPAGRRQNAHGEMEVLVKASALPEDAHVLASDLPQAASGLRVKAVLLDPDGEPQVAG